MTPEAGVQKACNLLGLLADMGYLVEVGGGLSVRCDVRIRDLGAPNGMLVFSRWDDVKPHADKLLEMGYAYSCFDSPGPNSTFDLDSFKAMFRDWGWAGEVSRKPDWL